MASAFRLEVDRRWLYAIAAVAWSGAGLILLGWTVRWLVDVSVPVEIGLGVAGALTAGVAGHFLFGRIVLRNIRRIAEGPDRASVFAFQPFKSYVVMASMIALGVVLRHSSLPRPALAVVYEAIGGALLGASTFYYRRFFTPRGITAE